MVFFDISGGKYTGIPRLSQIIGTKSLQKSVIPISFVKKVSFFFIVF